MSPPPPRRLTFAVSTSLLTASLSLGAAGCDEQSVNPAPKKEEAKDKPDHTVNVAKPLDPEPDHEPDHVNPGPEPEPDIDPQDTSPDPGPEEEIHVNEGPVPEVREPKRVNTRADPVIEPQSDPVKP